MTFIDLYIIKLTLSVSQILLYGLKAVEACRSMVAGLSTHDRSAILIRNKCATPINVEKCIYGGFVNQLMLIIVFEVLSDIGLF